ncbi:hypothetical protein Tco_1291947 [Tanacetum coccineum]
MSNNILRIAFNVVIKRLLSAVEVTTASYKDTAAGYGFYCCGPTTLVADETVYKERGDRVERATTTASSLEEEQDSGSSPRCQDTILGDRPAQTRFDRFSKQSNKPPLSRGRYAYDIEVNTASTSITTASINITTAEPVTTVSALVTTAGVSVSTVEPSTPPITTTIVIMKEASETTTRPTVPLQQELDPKDKEVVKGSRKKAEGSGKKVERSRKETVSKKRIRKGLDEESVKRQKLEDDAKKEELKACLEIVPNDDKAINIEPLATKSQIID